MGEIILGWQLSKPIDDGLVNSVIGDIKTRYQPLFEDRIDHTGLWYGNQGLVHFGFQDRSHSHVHREPDRIICSSGRPHAVLNETTGQVGPLDTLSLFRSLVKPADHEVKADVLGQIHPPFTLLWFDRARRVFGVVHDGLGFDQFFVAHTGDGLVVSNKCWPILRLLGMTPEIDFEGWKYWFVLGGFPGNQTPFQGIQVLDRGEVLHGDGESISSHQVDSYGSWFKRSRNEPIENLVLRAANTWEQIIQSNAPSHGTYSADLTGGWDSRTICSFLIKQNIPCTFGTSGSRFSSDVIIAKLIASKFDLEWRHRHMEPTSQTSLSPGLPSRFYKLALWAEGLVEPLRFRDISQEPASFVSVPNLHGGISEISRGFFYSYMPQFGKNYLFEPVVQRLLGQKDNVKCSILNNGDSYDLKGLLSHQIYKGEAYGLKGFDLLDFLYLDQRIRRWQAAHVATTFFNVPLAPFLNIDHIRLAFTLKPEDRVACTFQQYLIEHHCAALMHLPFTGGLYGKILSKGMQWASASALFHSWWNNFNWNDYFIGPGRGLVEKVLNSETPLWEIVDKSKAELTFHQFITKDNHDLMFLLRLISFHCWYETFCHGDKGLSLEAE